MDPSHGWTVAGDRLVSIATGTHVAVDTAVVIQISPPYRLEFHVTLRDTPPIALRSDLGVIADANASGAMGFMCSLRGFPGQPSFPHLEDQANPGMENDADTSITLVAGKGFLVQFDYNLPDMCCTVFPDDGSSASTVTLTNVLERTDGRHVGFQSADNAAAVDYLIVYGH
jgi:hypothetical protein